MLFRNIYDARTATAQAGEFLIKY